MPEVKHRTYYGMASVRPSVSHIMSAQYLEKFLSDSHGTWLEDCSYSVDDPNFLGQRSRSQSYFMQNPCPLNILKTL